MTLKQQDDRNGATPTRSSGGGTARKVVCLMAASVYAVGQVEVYAGVGRRSRLNVCPEQQ